MDLLLVPSGGSFFFTVAVMLHHFLWPADSRCSLCLPPSKTSVPPASYLFAQSGDVSLEGGVHPVEGLGFAEVLADILGQLLQLLVDLSHQLLPIVKVP